MAVHDLTIGHHVFVANLFQSHPTLGATSGYATYRSDLTCRKSHASGTSYAPSARHMQPAPLQELPAREPVQALAEAVVQVAAVVAVQAVEPVAVVAQVVVGAVEQVVAAVVGLVFAEFVVAVQVLVAAVEL